MTTKNFVVKNGLTVGNVTIDATTGNILALNANLGNLAIANFFSGDGSRLSNISGANITGNISGNISNANYASFAGVVTSSSQPNITSVGNLTSLIVSGNANVGGILTDNYYYANGSPVDFQQAGGSNTQVQFNDGDNFGGSANFTFDKTTNVLTVSGNISGANVIASGNVQAENIVNPTANTSIGMGNGSGILAITASGNTTSFNPSGQISLSGASQIVGGTFGGSGITLGASQTDLFQNRGGNVTVQTGSGGTISNTWIFGTNGVLTAPGNITTNANISSNNISATNQVVAGNGLQVTTGALSVLAGNLDVTGNLNVTGNVNYSNVTDLVVGDPLIYLGANNTGDTYDLGIVGSYNNGTYYHTGIARNAATDVWTFFDGVVAEPTTVIDWANAIYPSVQGGNFIATNNVQANLNITANGNISGNYILGNGAYLTGIDTAGVSNGTSNIRVLNNSNILFSAGGTANVLTVTSTGANVEGYLTITTGTISGNGAGLTNINGANVSEVANANYSTYSGTAYSVSGANVSGEVAYANVANNVAGANVSGEVANANYSTYSGTAYSVSGANVSGEVAYANVANNVSGSNVSGEVAYANVANNVAGANVSGQVAYANVANNVAGANVSGQVGNALIAGTVYGNAQANITSVGTLTILDVSGNVTAGNISGANVISGNFLTGTLTTAAQPNITSVGTLSSLDVTGNVSGNYVILGGGLSTDRTNVAVTTNTLIDSFDPTTFRTAKYIISASGDDGYQSVETLLVHNGVDSYITIYGSVCSNNTVDIIELSSNVNGVTGNVSVYASSSSANALVNLVASYIKT